MSESWAQRSLQALALFLPGGALSVVMAVVEDLDVCAVYSAYTICFAVVLLAAPSMLLKYNAEAQ